jgi:uracil phosphoribosyltransferase
MVHILNENNSIFNRFLAEIRDSLIQKDRMRFRKNMERIAEFFAYEISKTMDFVETEVNTPLGVARINNLKQEPVIASILRAGIPMHEGFLNIFDKADNAFISAYRKYESGKSFTIECEYISSPDITGRTLILADPMLATGSSLVVVYNALLKIGIPSHTHIVSAIASKQGVENLLKMLPGDNLTIWTGAVDDELNVKSYIIPGLGDAGDLAYGEKL